MTVIGACECGGMLTPFNGRLRCIFCKKKYEYSEVTYKED